MLFPIIPILVGLAYYVIFPPRSWAALVCYLASPPAWAASLYFGTLFVKSAWPPLAAKTDPMMRATETGFMFELLYYSGEVRWKNVDSIEWEQGFLRFRTKEPVDVLCPVFLGMFFIVKRSSITLPVWTLDAGEIEAIRDFVGQRGLAGTLPAR